MARKRLVLVLAALFAITVAVAACSSDDEGAAQSAAQEDIAIQFSWVHNISWAGIYMAESEGLYADENLSVELRTVFDSEGNFIDHLGEVVAGNAQFGVVDASTFLGARGRGLPLVAIASVYQRHPLVLTSLADQNIVRPQDLIGKTVQVSNASAPVFQALLASQDIDPAEVNVVTRTDFTVDPLLSGDADVLDAWVTSEVAALNVQGYELNSIFPSDYGISVYANIIYTTEDMIANNQALVERFLRATLLGTEDAIGDPEMAAALTVARDEELDLAEQTEAMFQSLPLINPAGSNPGTMDMAGWQDMQDILLEQGVLETAVNLDDAFTLQFLDSIYAGG